MIDFQPHDNRILILPDPIEKTPEQTEGGVFIPDHLRQDVNHLRGTVVAVGPGAFVDYAPPAFGHNGWPRFTPMPFKPGDRVLYGRMSYTTLTFDGVDHIILREPDIYGRIGGVVSERVAGEILETVDA